MIRMKWMWIIVVIMVFIYGCSNQEKEHVLLANEIYMDSYSKIGQIRTIEEVRAVIEQLGKHGYIAIDSENQIDMINAEETVNFCQNVEEKEIEELIIYVISYYDGHTALRVQPLDEKCRELNRKYILPIGYKENNMFLCDWSEDNFGEINFYDMFDILYPLVYEQRVPYYAASNYEDALVYMIPETEFEQVIMSYFKIDNKTLQNCTRHNTEKRCYEYRPRGLYDWESPETPFPEVIDYIENMDGSISLMVNVVYPDMNVSKMFAHEVVVRPLENGNVQYVSNHIIPSDDNYEALWHEERLDDEMWRKIYGDEIIFIEKIERGEKIE